MALFLVTGTQGVADVRDIFKDLGVHVNDREVVQINDRITGTPTWTHLFGKFVDIRNNPNKYVRPYNKKERLVLDDYLKHPNKAILDIRFLFMWDKFRDYLPTKARINLVIVKQDKVEVVSFIANYVGEERAEDIADAIFEAIDKVIDDLGASKNVIEISSKKDYGKLRQYVKSRLD